MEWKSVYNLSNNTYNVFNIDLGSYNGASVRLSSKPGLGYQKKIIKNRQQ